MVLSLDVVGEFNKLLFEFALYDEDPKRPNAWEVPKMASPPKNNNTIEIGTLEILFLL
jgi:hypothetical protein